MTYYKHIFISYASVVVNRRLTMGNRLCVGQTDKETLDWLITELKKLIPSCEITSKQSFSNVVSIATIEKLQGKDEVVFAWTVNRFLEDGWEPYSVSLDGNNSRTYYLRKVTQ